MSTQPFPGFPDYLDAAAVILGHPEAAGPARRIATLSALANLCAQASSAEMSSAILILEKAEEFAVQLRVAALAAEQMLADLQPGAKSSSQNELTAPRCVRGDLTPKSTRSTRSRGTP